MRSIILIFLIFSVSFSFGQFSISGGISRNIDNFFGSNQGFNLGKQRLNNYNQYQIQFDYSKSATRVYGEVGYLTSNFHLEQRTSYHSGGGSSSSFSDNRTYHSQVSFGYLSNKLGLGVIAISKNRNKLWGSFSFNMFAKYEKLTGYSESDQVMYRQTSSNGNQTQTFVTTDYPPDYYSYNLISFNRSIFQFGAEMDWRVGFKNYFLGISTSIALCNRIRTFSNSYVSYYSGSNQTSLWNFNFGLKIGYMFKSKVKETPTVLPEK